jgi:hypothetical protein
MWGAVIALAGIALFALIGSREMPELTTAMLVAAGVLTGGAIVGAFVAAFHGGIAEAKRRWVFIVTEKALARREKGLPDIEIGLSEIAAINERRHWLVVESETQRQKIAVPREIENYSMLRSELARHCSITRAPEAPWIARVGMVVAILFYVCCAIVFWSLGGFISRLVGVAALLLLTWQFLFLGWRARVSRNRLLFRIMLFVYWAIALWFVYFRMQKLRGH